LINKRVVVSLRLMHEGFKSPKTLSKSSRSRETEEEVGSGEKKPTKGVT